MSIQALAGKFMELSARACCAWGCTTDIERRHHANHQVFPGQSKTVKFTVPKTASPPH